MDPRSVFILICFVFFAGITNAQTNERYIYSSGDLVIISDAARTEGVVYKVEVARLPFLDPNDPELNRLKNYGTLYTETLDNKDEKALLIGDFSDRKEAKKVKDQLHDNGFTSAQVLRYKNGLRQ